MSARHQRNHEGRDPHGWSLAHIALVFLAACAEDLATPLPSDPNDLDHDGIPNAADICPKAYDPDQHDEDGDGVGDACDDCPSIFDEQTNSVGSGFGDELGDACDPRPSVDGDKIAMVEPFADASDETVWVGDGWRIGADVARAVSTARWEHRNKETGDGLYVEIAVPLLVWLDAGSVEVAINGEGDGLRCALVHDGIGPDRLVARDSFGLSMTTEVGHVEAPFTLTAWRTIGFDRSGRLQCFLGGAKLDMMVDAVPAGTWSFASTGAITDVSSLVVYTYPIGPCARSTNPMCADD